MDHLELLKRALTGECYDESYWRRIRPDTVPLTQPVKRFLANQKIKLLERKGFQVILPCRPDARLRERRQRGKDHPLFGFTMVGRRRLDNFEKLIRAADESGVPGAIVECGVWRGGASILGKAVLNDLASNRHLWLCDSFEGLPAPSCPEDHGYDFTPLNDYLGVSVEQVKDNMSRFVELDDRIHFLKGFFKDTLENAAIDSIAVLRIDGDLYESTIQCLKALHHKDPSGGFVIIDDYGVLEPCRTAVKEFLEGAGLKPEIHDIDGTGVYWQVP